MKYLIVGLLSLFSFNLKGQKMNIIQETIHKLFIATDQQDWKTVQRCFASKVILDYSSMTGNPAATVTPQQMIESWQGILPGFEHTHHQLGNFLIQENPEWATAFCYGTATHYLENEGQNLWNVVGSYDFKLTPLQGDWKISKMKFNFKYQTGNTALPQLAINQVKSNHQIV